MGVGAYRTEEGKPLVLTAVKEAERRILSENQDKEYLGIGGIPEFCDASASMAFGVDSAVVKEKRNATVQCLSGTGSLRVGAEFLSRFYVSSSTPGTVLLPTPTWPNHKNVFERAGISVQQYRYYKPETRALDYEGLIEDVKAAPEGSILLLHACAHNPTGVDPTPEQWNGILEVATSKKLLPFFDSAYQGFASGDLEKDAYSIRLFADAGIDMLLAQSYAKNMGLYGERVGALTVVTSETSATGKVMSQLKSTIRAMYSNPPKHGASIAMTILRDPQLYSQWREELKGMAGRIMLMRNELRSELERVGAPGTWNHITDQIGMFSFTGLTRPQVEMLTSKWHVYMTMDGRISMAGLSKAKCSYLAEGINDVMRNA